MNNNKKGVLFTAYTYSPLHAGTGQTVGVVDLPIEREKHTGYPCVYATGLKGSLRQYWKNENWSDLEKIFGEENASAGAGGGIFTDLKILLFPVRSSHGTFTWVTCDRVINRFKRDYRIAFGKEPVLPQFSKLDAIDTEPDSIDPDAYILLEDYMFNVTPGSTEAGKNDLTHIGNDLLRAYLVEEDYFTYFVKHATQIIARNVLKENKTSKNLWYEEALPADTVLYSFILPSVTGTEDMMVLLEKELHDKTIQIGGNETVGYGITHLHFVNVQKTEGGGQ